MKLKTIVVGLLSVNAYLYYNEETMTGILIDPGAEGDMLIEKINNLGLKIQAILLTHGHFDHMSAINELKKFTGAEIYAHELEKTIVEDSTLNLSANFSRSAVTSNVDKLLKNDDILNFDGFNLRVIHTPGHTSGSACYYDKDSEILFSGDTLFNCSVGRTDFPTGNYDDIVHSVRKKLYTLPDSTEVYPGHGDKTNIGFEKLHNGYVTLKGSV